MRSASASRSGWAARSCRNTRAASSDLSPASKVFRCFRCHGALFYAAAIPSFHWNEQAKRRVLFPAIDFKVAVQRQDVARFEFISQTNKAGIGEIHFPVPVLGHNPANRLSGAGNRKWNPKDSCFDVLHDRFGCAREVSQQVAALGDNGLTGYQRLTQLLDCLNAPRMISFATVEQGDDDPGIQEHRFQRPKPFRWALVEPRSAFPDENFPNPTIRLAAPLPWQASRSRMPSRTTLEGLHPRRRTRLSSLRRDSRSSLACTLCVMGPVYYISTSVVHAPEAGRREGKGNYPPGSL